MTAVTGYTASSTPADPSEVAKIVGDLADRVAGIEHDVATLIEHPSAAAGKAVAVDAVMTLSVLAGAAGLVEQFVPASRGVVSLALIGIGWGLVVAKHAVDVLGGN